MGTGGKRRGLPELTWGQAGEVGMSRKVSDSSHSELLLTAMQEFTKRNLVTEINTVSSLADVSNV